MKYSVRVVGNDELPEGIERVIVERPEGAPLLLLAESAAQTWRFLCEWQSAQEVEVENVPDAVVLHAV